MSRGTDLTAYLAYGLRLAIAPHWDLFSLYTKAEGFPRFEHTFTCSPRRPQQGSGPTFLTRPSSAVPQALTSEPALSSPELGGRSVSAFQERPEKHQVPPVTPTHPGTLQYPASLTQLSWAKWVVSLYSPARPGFV